MKKILIATQIANGQEWALAPAVIQWVEISETPKITGGSYAQMLCTATGRAIRLTYPEPSLEITPDYLSRLSGHYFHPATIVGNPEEKHCDWTYSQKYQAFYKIVKQAILVAPQSRETELVVEEDVNECEIFAFDETEAAEFTAEMKKLFGEQVVKCYPISAF